jgi:hypothetical protein
MKRLLTGLLGAAVLASAGAAVAQPYDSYRYDHRYDNDRYEHRYDRDRDRDRDRDWRYHDNGYHRGWYNHHRHYGSPFGVYHRQRVCAWRYGERVCWWRSY